MQQNEEQSSTKILEIKDTLTLQDLQLQGGKDNGPSWEELQALYQAYYPETNFESARSLLQQKLWQMSKESDLALALAEVYFAWVGLSWIAWKEKGIGQEKMVRGLRKLWKNIIRGVESPTN